MSDYEMNRSRTQVGMTYAPGSFFSFEGGMGACHARPVKASTAESLGDLVETQILELIEERARSWLEQAMNAVRTASQPPIREDLVLGGGFRSRQGNIELLRDSFKFLVPDRVGYEPMPMTFVCRRCDLLQAFGSVKEFCAKRASMRDNCPSGAASCADSWEQLDVAFVHWSGGFEPITLKVNRWDPNDRAVDRRSVRCVCGGERFKLLRPAPVFSKWRLECTACSLAQPLPEEQDRQTLEVIGEGISTGSHWRIESNMEPISIRANAAYYVQADRLLVFVDDKWFKMLRLRQNDALAEFLALEYGYPQTPLSDEQKEDVLVRAGRGGLWKSYKDLRAMLHTHEEAGNEAGTQPLRDALRAMEAQWADDLPMEMVPSPVLTRAVRERQNWMRRYDPIRQAVEHKTLAETILGPKGLRGVVNVRHPDKSLLPGLRAADEQAAVLKIGEALDLLGIEDMRMVREFPVCEFSFGYTRTSPDPVLERKKNNIEINLPVRLNLFDRVYITEDEGARRPIYVLRQDNEAFYVRLDEEIVRRWLEANEFSITLPGPHAKLGAMLIEEFASQPFSKWLDEYRGKPQAGSRNPYAYVYTLLHTMAHHLMHELAQVSGLDLGNMSEHLFVPDLAYVVYRRGTTMDLNYLSSAWRACTDPTVGNAVLRRMLDPASLRCGSGSLCDNRGGACPDCILIPEVSCITRNALLSRSVLRGVGRPHWDLTSPGSVAGYYQVAAQVARERRGTPAP
ncbi:hypothetical protein [Salinarimonas rosea]|uniref:hypothetical protein n=1 Tax=Salinarimonas rosea TaxID=552063 RepID=UPI0003FD9DD1|nr:hypothetical protein [Salinarimonas rosea]